MEAFVAFPVSAMVKKMAVGASQHFSFIMAATLRKRMGGTSMAVRHAAVLSTPKASKGFTRRHKMKTWVMRPPRWPQPAAVAFAVPTTLGANIREYHGVP